MIDPKKLWILTFVIEFASPRPNFIPEKSRIGCTTPPSKSKGRWICFKSLAPKWSSKRFWIAASVISLSQLGGSWHCWGVDCFDRSLVPFMNGQAWVCPPWKIRISSPENQWLKDEISFWDGIFSRAMLVLGSVSLVTPKKTTLKSLSKTSAEKWTNCLPFAILCVLISILLMKKQSDIWPLTWWIKPCKSWDKLPTLPFVYLGGCVAPPWRCSWTQPGGYCTIETHAYIYNVYIYRQYIYIYI